MNACLECRRLTIQNVGRGYHRLQSVPVFTVQALHGIPFSRDAVLRQQLPEGGIRFI